MAATTRTIVTTELRCDRCGTRVTFDGNVADARRAAKFGQGWAWLRLGYKAADLCGDCHAEWCRQQALLTVDARLAAQRDAAAALTVFVAAPASAAITVAMRATLIEKGD